MVETQKLFEDAIKEAESLMMNNKHVECEAYLREIVETAEKGSLKNKSGENISASHPNFLNFLESDLFKTQTEMKVLFDEFHEMLGKIEGWDLYQHQNLIKNDIKLYHSKVGTRFNMMATFNIDWNIQTVASLFFEADSIPKWCRIPNGQGLQVEHQICPTVYSCKASMQPSWMPISQRFINAKMMIYMEPSVNGFMVVVKSHEKEKTEFFGKPLPETPKGAVTVNIMRQYRYFEKIDEKTTRVVILNDIDPGMGIIPDKLKNVMMQKGLANELPNMKNAFTDIKPEFEKKFEEKKEFYTKMAEFLIDE